MGKKGKVNKMARMSDEERARYLQHRADLEEEARRRKRELISKFIKNKLDKEESYSRTNTAKINQEWRYILRKIKCKQLAQDIKGLKANFDYLVERKNRQIDSLVRSLEDGDEQHRRVFQAHTEALSYFLDVGIQRLDKLSAQYEQQKNKLLENGEKDETKITDNQERAEFQLKLIMYIQDKQFQNYMKTNGVEIATAKNDARLEHEEDMHMFSKPKQLELSYYWSQLREVYSSFLERHKPILGHYNTLREKDEFYQRDIARNEAQIQQATELLLSLQKEWFNITNSNAHNLRRLNRKKEELATRCCLMKKEAKNEGCRGDSALELMVNCSQDTIQHIENFKAKLEKCRQLYEICSKYETEEDVAAFNRDDADAGVGQELNDYEHLDKDMLEECKEYRKLEKFMMKMNRAKIQYICLKTERDNLLKENMQLKYYIKRYLTEMALRGGKDRPFSVKLYSEFQKTDANGKVKNRPVTCIEGALSNAVLHEKRLKIQERKNKENSWKSYPRVQCFM